MENPDSAWLLKREMYVRTLSSNYVGMLIFTPSLTF